MNETIIYKVDGEVTNVKALATFLNTLPDGKFLITAKNIRKRSLPLNAYYWGVIVPSVREGLVNNGYREVKTNEQAHEILKHLFLKKQVINYLTGSIIEVTRSTADLTNIEFNAYMEEIWQWSSEYLGVYIEAPNTQSKLFAV